MRFFISLPVLALIGQAFGVASTDEYRDADIGQSGYLSNHNMDPNIVNSASFGLQWKVPFNTNEQFYAKPLTYTPLAGGNQLLFLASSQNWIRTLDAKTGALINSRQVHTPFLQSDIGCTDIPNTIGITGTPTIDPATDIVYFFSKTYIPNYRVAGNTGTANGVYYFHAVNINTLADVYPPVLIDGSVADNDPAKYFVGGVILQRPSVIQVGTIVYGAFGGHCDLFNYTGVIVGVDINAAKIVTQFAMESGPLAEQTNVLLSNGAGGEAGIWMSGMGIASDGDRLFVVTGNGAAHQNQGTPASGSSPLATLGQCALNLAVNAASGVLSLTDYFQPFDYQNSDANDQDFGSGGIVLLDPTVFSGGGVAKMAVTAGKNGKVYILNVNNLGGYRLGTGQGDNVLQTIVTDESVFGAAGSYPGEGGWIYFTPVGYATYAYQLGLNAAGIPQFTQVAKTNEISAGRVGVGIPTVTTLNGEAGTAILWMTDPDAGIRAWYAVPQNGVLVNIPLPQIGGANKFQRPAFGDARVYTTDSNGVLYCLGSPVNLPLNCTSPVQFGSVALGTKVTKTVTCTANIAITQVVGLTIENAYFQASNASLPTGSLTAGQSFSFPVTWDLTNANSANAANASYGNISPGVKSTPLTLTTINGVADYMTSFPVGLTGTEVSNSPFLGVSPNTVDFGGIVVTSSSGVQTETASISIANQGQSAMTIIGYAYTTANRSIFTNSTVNNGTWDLGYGFTTATLPAIGSQISANTAVSVDAVFNPVGGIGDYVSYWQVWTDGGTANVVLEGTASTAPIANFSISTSEGGWLPQSNLLMDFGDVAPGSSASLQIRICNQGGSSLEIDKSKPPNGVFRISDPTELEETLQIVPGTCAYGTVLMNAPVEEYDIPNLVVNNTWTLNTNDPNFGVHTVEITATIVSKKVGPTNSTTGQPIYNYLGCFAESTNGPRLFPNEPASPSANNDNAYCQTTCYNAAEYAFAGTEYGDECWCGNIPPPLASQDLTDTRCNTACPADASDSCGQSGWISVYYDPTKYTKGANPALYGPQTPQVVGNYILQGCYSEGTNGRALSAQSPTPPAGGFTLELCEAACQGYTYWGMEYSNQCFCGNSLAAGSVNQTSLVPSVSGCNMLCTGNQNEYCGGPNRLNLYMLNTSAPIAPPATTSSNTVSSSSLSAGGTSSSISVSTSASTSATSVSSSTSASTSASPSPTGPQTVTNLAGWNYLGCWTEATNTRALNGHLLPITAANTNVENCAAACSAYTYFGVEYSQECYCGNVINAGSVNSSTVPNANPCNMVCADNPNEYCGGRSVLNLYQVAPVVSSSSVSSFSTASPPTLVVMSSTTSSSSTLSSSSSVVSSTSSIVSAAATTSLSSTISSISAAPTTSSTTSTTSSSSTGSSTPTSPSTTSTSSTTSSSSTQSSTSTTPSTSSTSSTMSSSSTQSSTSASPSTSSTSSTSPLSTQTTVSSTSSTSSAVVAATSSSTFVTSSTSSTIITTSTTSSTSAATPSWTGTPAINSTIGPWEYLGCASEVSGRTLTGSSYSDGAAMTIESCQAFCTSHNYALAGLEYASQCYCANSMAPTSTLGNTGCSMTCTGNGAETCGGPNRLSLFNNTAYIYPGNPKSANSYNYVGCFAEATNGRLLSGVSYSDGAAMTVESCTAFCKTNVPGGGYAGVEYASQCFCGAAYSQTPVASTSCNMLCTGNNKEFCGGSGTLNVYQYQAPAKKVRDLKGRGVF